MDNYSEHILYNKVQSVRMPDCKIRDLRITVSETGRPFKKVALKITDDEDPSLLYYLHVTELDFACLKAEQGLLVDFSNFAVHLVRLLEQCDNNIKGFLVVIEEGLSDTSLKIVQPVDLKNLCYISLHIAPGSDSEILNHMKCQIQNLKSMRESDEQECTILRQQVSQLKRQLQEKDFEFQRLEDRFSEEQEAIKKKAAAEMSLLRDHLMMEKTNEIEILERKNEGLKTEVQEATSELKNLKEKHRKLTEKYEDTQQHMRELNNCIANLENNRSQMREEITDLRGRNSDLEEIYRKRDQELDNCRAQNEKMEKELNKMCSRIAHQDQQLHSSGEEQAKLRSTVAKLQEKYNARDELLRQVTTDLTKANLIIKERQKELEALHKELQELAVDSEEKQHQLTNQDLEMNLLKATVKKSEEKIQLLSIKEKELTTELASLKKALSAKEEEHAKCGDVISYLHRSLKKVQLESNMAPSPILQSGTVIPAPTFASINPSGLGLGPYYSTPLGATGLLTTAKRRSYPGTVIDPVGEKIVSAARKSEELIPKEALKPTQIVSQKKHKRPDPARSKDKPPAKGSSEKTVSAPVKSKEKGQQEPKDASKKTENKENKKAPAFKPSSYFQPNRITTDF